MTRAKKELIVSYSDKWSNILTASDEYFKHDKWESHTNVKDDLKLVEGIGPVIEKVFNDAGYNTWASVAGADAATLKSILDGAGDQFAMHDPGTWPKQCQLMVDDKWSELKKYQDELDGGKMN